MGFEVGGIYKCLDNSNLYKVIRINGDRMDCTCNNLEWHFRFIPYCGVEAVIKYGKPFLLSSKIKPVFIPEIDLKTTPVQNNNVILNSDKKGYINVFKSHYKNKEAK